MNGIAWAVATALLTAGAATTGTLTLALLCSPLWWIAPVPGACCFIFFRLAETMFRP